MSEFKGSNFCIKTWRKELKNEGSKASLFYTLAESRKPDVHCVFRYG